MLWRTVYGLMSPSGPQAKLSVLLFHRVLPAADPMAPSTPDAAMFDRICGWLANWFKVLPLDEAMGALCEGRLPARAAAVTFDDGYADNLTLAAPVLQRHGLNATFFVATGYLDGGRMWNDTVAETLRRASGAELDLTDVGLDGIGVVPVSDWGHKRAALRRLLDACKYLDLGQRMQVVERIAARGGKALPDDLMLRSDQLLSLRRTGMLVGAHTRDHAILARLDRDEAKLQVQRSRDDLQSLLGDPVRMFAYPNGKPGEDYNAMNVEVVREAGFEIAVSTAWGAAGRSVDPLQVPRFTPWGRSSFGWGRLLAGNLNRKGAWIAPTSHLAAD